MGDRWVCLWAEDKAGAKLFFVGAQVSEVAFTEDTRGGLCFWWRKMSSSQGNVGYWGPGRYIRGRSNNGCMLGSGVKEKELESKLKI